MGVIMLASLKFTLTTSDPVRLPPHLGRAARAALLRIVAASDPGLAERLHASDQRRPYTCSTLWGAPVRRGSLVLDPDNEVYLRFTGLTAELSAHLQRLAEEPPPYIELERVRLEVRGATLDGGGDPWAGQATYQELASAHLLGDGSPSHRAELHFASPTAFRSGGRTVPLPLPELVYGSLVETWNAFAPVGVSEEVRRFAAECLAISRYRLSTRAVSAKGGSVQIGFVGHCCYTALNRDRYWLGVIQLLTDYAFYAGVGYQTTAGMGQVRRNVS